MDQARAGRHPLHAAFVDDALMAGAVAVGQRPLQHEGHRLEAAMRMRAEGQAAIVRRIDLRAVVIEEEKGAQLVDLLPGQGAPRDEIGDIVAIGLVQANDGLGLGHGNLREAGLPNYARL